MASNQEILSPEIERRGDAGSPSFSIRVRRGVPDFLNSVSLKYVKLGYLYLLSHQFYFLTTPVVVVILGAGAQKVALADLGPGYDKATEALCVLGLLVLVVSMLLDMSPRATYLVDFACYRPPSELKITKSEFIDLAKNSGNFDDESIEFQRRILDNSGIGDKSYMPRTVFAPANKITLREGRAEAAQVMFGAIDDLLAATGVRAKDINILVVNCGILNITPSLSAMVVNHYKLRPDINSFNLGGMGCAAGVVAVDLARDLLNAHPGSYALVVSTEIVTSAWYTGRERDMLIPNCFFRMGAAAILLSNRRLDWWRSKYELNQIVRTHKGSDDRSFNCISWREDSEAKQGLSISREWLHVCGHAVKANITTLAPLVLPLSEQPLFFKSLLFNLRHKKKSTKAYVPNYNLAFHHACILASSRRALDELQTNLELNHKYMEASRKTLERFGNTSSSSVWYGLAYLEANGKIKRGEKVWQLAFGSGFKCNSMVWKARKCVGRPKRSPWIEEED